MVRRIPRALRAPTLCASLLLFTGLAACGGGTSKASTSTPGGANPGASPTSTTASSSNDSSASPVLTMPVSRYVISLDDLGTDFITNVPLTFVLTSADYATSRTFASPDEGKKLLGQWGYLGGYETSFRPEGGEKAVLTGAYYIYVEAHLFKDESGAKQAYDYFEGKLKSGFQPATADPVGNSSSAWKTALGKVSGSTVDAVDLRYVFRRGNLVTVVRATGADPLMNPTIPRSLAGIVDAKALGKVPAVEPTPTSNFNPSKATASQTAAH